MWGAKKLCAPLPEKRFDGVLIFFHEKLIEACRDLAKHGFDAALRAIVRMQVEIAGRRGFLAQEGRQKGDRREACRKEKERSALAGLQEFSPAKIDGTAFLRSPAQ